MNKTILVVEDSRTQAMLLENILEGHGYRVAIAADGEEAMKWLSEHKPSLVISDIVMPEMNGYELCRKIRTKKSTSNIPVILLTSLNGTEEVIEGLVAGADSFITKPFDQDYLISHIGKILADQSGINTERESVGVEITFEGKKRIILSDQQQTIKLLLNIYEGAIQQNAKLLHSQEQLKYMNDNLESLVEERTLELSEETKLSVQVAEQLLKVNAEKDKFFSIIAHDLRGPLSSFLGLTQLMDEDLSTMKIENLQELASGMKVSAQNLYRLLENLLQWAKIQRGLVPFDPAVVSLLPIMNEALTIVSDSAINKNITVKSEIPDNLAVFADINMLQTVIRNLISNAVKFTRKGGEININAKIADEGNVEVSIVDTGIGISPEMLRTLFELNTKLGREGTEGEPSSGLGLILCKEFIEKLGGRLYVESKVGVGSKFSFTIPLNLIPEQTSDQTGSVFDQGESIKAGGLNVLIADDDEGSGRLIALIVKSFAAKVIRVKNGVEEVKAFRDNPNIDLVITDIQMPEMDGYEAVKQIRQLNDKVIIIAMTDFAKTGEKEIAQEVGCTDYISKPIKKDQMIGIMKKYFFAVERHEYI